MIVAAAIRREGKVWTLPAPARHHNIISEINYSLGLAAVGPVEQGFIDHSGNFLNRKEAARHADDCGQKSREELKWPPNLFTEDLW